jgi:hypothetical protein
LVVLVVLPLVAWALGLAKLLGLLVLAKPLPWEVLVLQREFLLLTRRNLLVQLRIYPGRVTLDSKVLPLYQPLLPQVCPEQLLWLQIMHRLLPVLLLCQQLPLLLLLPHRVHLKHSKVILGLPLKV